MTRALAAEWTRLARARTLRWVLPLTVAYAAVITYVMMATAPALPDGNAISKVTLAADGGGILSVVAGAAFTSVLLLAVFVGLSAGTISRGTWRAALLHQPRRWSLAAGTFAAQVLFIAMLAAVVLAVGLVSAYLIAPSFDVSTDAWMSSQSWRLMGEDYLRIVAFAAGWGLLGTMIGILTRSVAVGLGLGILWAGPVEHLLGDQLSFVRHWSPGLVLQDMLVPDSAVVSEPRAGITLACYAVAVIVLVAVILRRRDVTS